MENLIEIDDNYILESDLENYKQKLAEYNRLYDMENTTDLGDNVGSLSESEMTEMNGLEKELEELRTKGKKSIRLEMVDDKVVFASDLKRYNELKNEYNRLYDMENATDFGDNISNLSEEELEELNNLEKEITLLEEKGKRAINIVDYEGEKILFQDLEEYKKIKAEYNRLYDMQNSTDFGDDIDNLTPEEVEEMNRLYEQLENIKSRAQNISKIKYSKESLEEETIKKEHDDEEKNQTGVSKNDEDTNNNDEEIDKESKEDDLSRKYFTDAIEKEKELGNSLEEDKLEEWAKKITESIKKLYEYDQEKFKTELENTVKLDDKLNLIEKREQQIESGYEEFFKHNREAANEILKKEYNTFKNEIKELYDKDKSNGEYVWANFDEVKESRDYIRDNIDNDKDWNYQFNVLMASLDDLVNNPNKEDYETWKTNMSEFIKNGNFDVTKITPYLNAYLKNKNNDLSIDNNLNISGLNFQKEKGQEPEINKPKKEDNPEKEKDNQKKKRNKVTNTIKNINEWFKKHPKIKLLAMGLGLALTASLGLSGLMVINSALWGTVNGTTLAFIQPLLHTINLGISKVIGLGSIKYAAESGLYMTGGGSVLYHATAPTIIAAIAKLGISIPIGKKLTEKIKSGWNDIKKKKEEPVKQEPTKEEPDKEVKPEEKSKEQEKVEDLDEKITKKDTELETSPEVNSRENTELLMQLKEALKKSQEQVDKLTEQNRIMSEKLSEMYKMLAPEQKQQITGSQLNQKEVAELSDDRKILS